MANQPARAATGQQYGKATEQLESQQAVPLPQNIEPTMRPGEAGPLLRPTDHPEEPINAPMVDAPLAHRDSDPGYSAKVARLMPILLDAASKPTASPSTRNIVNQWKSLVGPIDDNRDM